jgi:hypothetical protein
LFSDGIPHLSDELLGLLLALLDFLDIEVQLIARVCLFGARMKMDFLLGDELAYLDHLVGSCGGGGSWLSGVALPDHI